jgi:hypothetical protein
VNLNADFWTGVAVVPALIVLAAGALLANKACVELRARLANWHPRYTADIERRAREAAALAVADRMVVVHVPGGRVVAWRRPVNELSSPGRQAYAHMYDALQDALRSAARDPLASRDEPARLYGGRDLADPEAHL